MRLNCESPKSSTSSQRLEIWHGFIFVNLDPLAEPLAPSLAKVEPFWAGYENADLVGIPPGSPTRHCPGTGRSMSRTFTDAYHPEFVHRGTHDFAPSVTGDGGVVFTEMKPGDNAIVRTVPMLQAGRRHEQGWLGREPGISADHDDLCGAAAAADLRHDPAEHDHGICAERDRLHAALRDGRRSDVRIERPADGRRWLLPRSTIALPDFNERAAQVLEGGAKIWAQDVPENMGMQRGKKSSLRTGRRLRPARNNPRSVQCLASERVQASGAAFVRSGTSVASLRQPDAVRTSMNLHDPTLEISYPGYPSRSIPTRGSPTISISSPTWSCQPIDRNDCESQSGRSLVARRAESIPASKQIEMNRREFLHSVSAATVIGGFASLTSISHAVAQSRQETLLVISEKWPEQP